MGSSATGDTVYVTNEDGTLEYKKYVLRAQPQDTFDVKEYMPLPKDVLTIDDPINITKVENKASLYAGHIDQNEKRADAYMPSVIFASDSIIDENQYLIFRDVLGRIPGMTTQNILPDKLYFKFQIGEGSDSRGVLMYVVGKYKLSDELMSLFSFGQELLHRVSLTQYNLTQDERKWIKSQNFKQYVIDHINDNVFLRLWSVLITASLRSTSVFSMDPSKWVDPKILAIQKNTSERTAAEINQYMLDNK